MVTDWKYGLGKASLSCLISCEALPRSYPLDLASVVAAQPGSQTTLVAGRRHGPPAVCIAGQGLCFENTKLLAVPPGPCRAGHGRLRFLPNSILGCLSCAGLRMGVRRCRLCSAYPYWVLLLHCLWGVWGFLLVPVANLRVTRFRQKTAKIRSISARLVRRRAR